MADKLQEGEQEALDHCVIAVRDAQRKLGSKVRLHVLMERKVK